VNRNLYLWGGTFVVLPFIYMTQVFDGALFPRLQALQLGCLGVSLSIAYSRKSVRIPAGLAIATTVWIGAMGLSILQAVNLTKAVHQFGHYLTFALVPLLMVWSLRQSHLPGLAKAVTFASIPVSLLGIAQYLGLSPFDVPTHAPPSAMFIHRNAAAGYLTGIIPIAWFCALTSDKKMVWLTHAVAGLLGMVFLIFTRTRGAWLGAILALVVVVFLARFFCSSVQLTKRTVRERFVLIGLAFFVIIGALAAPDRISSDDRPAFDDKKPTAVKALTSMLDEGADRGRYGLWINTAGMVKNHLFLGVGLGNWEYHYPAYARGDHVNINAAPRRPHNDLLWILSETGILGLLTYLFLIAVTFRQALQVIRVGAGGDRLFALAMLAVMLAHLVDGMFNFPRERVGGASLFWLALGSVWILVPNRGRLIEASPVWALPAAVVVAWFAYTTWKQIEYDYHHLRVHTAERSGDWHTVLTQGRKAVHYGDYRANTWIAMGRAHYRFGEIDDAIRAQEKAISLHPNSLNAHNNLGVAYRKAGRASESIASLEQAIYLYPGFVEARNNLGNALRDVGRIDESILELEALAAREVRIPQVYVNLGRSYIAKGDAARARRSFKAALEMSPNHPAAIKALQTLGPETKS
jgi:O-antigen ligase/Flp pilus assembly protein TadD